VALFPMLSGLGVSAICTFAMLTVAPPTANPAPAAAKMAMLPALTGVTVTFALVDPGETVTVGGTVAMLVLLLTRLTICPPAPAGADRLSVSEPGALAAIFSGFGASVICTFVTLTVAAPAVKPAPDDAVRVVLPR